jgi:hypothetical protein
LNVHNVRDVTQTETHTAEKLVPGPNHLELEIAIAKMKKYKFPGSDQIPAKLIHAGGETLVSVILKIINSVWNKEELPDQWKEPIIVPVHKKVNKTDCKNCRWISLLSTSYKILLNILLSRLSPYIWNHKCGFRHNRSTTGSTVHSLFNDFKKAYYSVRREVLYNILIEFGIPVKLERLIKMCLNET